MPTSTNSNTSLDKQKGAHGSQFTSLAFGHKLIDHGIAASMGRVGSAYDNALMESTIGLYITHCIARKRRSERQNLQDSDTKAVDPACWTVPLGS